MVVHFSTFFPFLDHRPLYLSPSNFSTAPSDRPLFYFFLAPRPHLRLFVFSKKPRSLKKMKKEWRKGKAVCAPTYTCMHYAMHFGSRVEPRGLLAHCRRSATCVYIRGDFRDSRLILLLFLHLLVVLHLLCPFFATSLWFLAWLGLFASVSGEGASTDARPLP
jgi:hypothetical protein